jgi:hypothetical protein
MYTGKPGTPGRVGRLAYFRSYSLKYAVNYFKKRTAELLKKGYHMKFVMYSGYY